MNSPIHQWVASPALAYNVIAVGGMDDRNTSSWSDDQMYLSSSFRNPVSAHGDREKPEVVAPAVSITTTGLNGAFRAVDGTSFAAPHVAGAAALLMQRNSTLQYWPEVVKAVLMATAVHNIEGFSRLSDFDGAGGISVDIADQLVSFTQPGCSGSCHGSRLNGAARFAANDQGRWILGNSGGVGPRQVQTRPTTGGDKWKAYTITPTTPGWQYSPTFSTSAGRRVRAVIAWDTTPSYPNYHLQPGVDLDLYVYAPSGPLVASSVSFDNTYEIVEFIAPETGNYRLSVQWRRFDDPLTYLGIAWNDF